MKYRPGICSCLWICPVPRGAGGLKCKTDYRRFLQGYRPVPRGAGGLKSDRSVGRGKRRKSRPARGGWIEIPRPAPMPRVPTCPVPRGAGGLKCKGFRNIRGAASPVPRGAGGLKFVNLQCRDLDIRVPSREGRAD